MSASAARASSTVSGTTSTTQSTRRTGAAGSPSTRPTRSHSSAQAGGKRRSSPATTSLTVGADPLVLTAGQLTGVEATGR